MDERLAFNVGVPGSPATRPPTRLRDHPPVRAAAAAARGEVERTDWAYVGMLAFTVLLFFRPQDQIGPLARLHLTELAAIGALAALAVGRLSRRLPPTRMTPELAGVTAMAAVMAFAVPFSIWPGGALHVLTGIYLKVVLIFLLMVNTLTSPRRIEQMTWIIVLASSYIATRAVYDYVRGVNLVEGNRVRGALGGIFANPNDLALNLVTFLAPTIFIALEDRRRFRRLVASAAVLLMFAAVIFTKSRSGFLGLLVMLAVCGVYLVRVRPLVLALGLVVSLAALPMLPDSFWTRMSSIVNEEEDVTGSREARRELMERAVIVFAERPLTGIGAGQFQNYAPDGEAPMWRVTHNALLQVAAELGILGVAVFLFLIGRGFYGLRAARRILTAPANRPSTARAGPRSSRSVARWRRGLSEAGDEAEDALGLTRDERRQMHIACAAFTSALAGWFVCAMFASVAYNWTFYYVLGLSAACYTVIHDRRVRAAAGAAAIAEGRTATGGRG
jgi:O-antigen ligase